MSEREETKGKSLHSGLYGHCYIYYRSDNDDDEEICRACAMNFYRTNGYRGNCNSQYRAFEGDGNGICGRCKENSVKAYWTCCFSIEEGSTHCD